MSEFHVERADDGKRIWVRNSCFDFWCFPIYSHSWNTHTKKQLSITKPRLYHVFKRDFYNETWDDCAKTIAADDFYYNIGEFVLVDENIGEEDLSDTELSSSVKTVIVNLNENKVKRENTTKVKNVVANLVKDPFPELKKSAKDLHDWPKLGEETKQLTKGAQNWSKTAEKKKDLAVSPIIIVKEKKEEQDHFEKRLEVMEITDSVILSALKEKKIHFKHIIALISHEDVLIRKLLLNIALVSDQQQIRELLNNLQSKRGKYPNSGNEFILLSRVSDSLIRGSIDFDKVFYNILDETSYENCDLFKQIVKALGRRGEFEHLVCIEEHKILIDTKYSQMNKIFTDCIRLILAWKGMIVDDENERIKKLRDLFSISDKLTSRIIEDRYAFSHRQIQRNRLKHALEDRVQLLRHVQTNFSNKNASKRIRKDLELLNELANDPFFQ